ncbi:MAG TPA: hypothetical protein VGP93_17465, partial [Polyangiaceae bacterium]|nr:hypothetical protein [Polyangiaceae bacterium]
MTFARKQLAVFALAAFAASACGSSSGDYDAAPGPQGAVLGSTAGAVGQGGRGNASAGDGGSVPMTGGKGAAGPGGTSSAPAGGRGTPAASGTAGTGNAGSGGKSGTSGTTGAGPLGAACDGDDDCEDGLLCITSDSDTLGAFGPAGGLCTRACTDHGDCSALTPGAYCVAFDDAGTLAFCLEGCTPGTAGEPKCQERADMGCSVVGFCNP